jgi:hypothetical protein
MNTLRYFYRNIFIELVLLLAVATQIYSGLKLFAKSRKIAVSNFEKLHIYSGVYLAIFLMIHVGAVLVGRIFLGLDTNFYFGVAGLITFPFNLFFIPYYLLSILSVFGHIAAIHMKKARINILFLSPKAQAKVILMIGLILTFIIFVGLTNNFKGLIIPKEYHILIGR